MYRKPAVKWIFDRIPGKLNGAFTNYYCVLMYNKSKQVKIENTYKVEN